MNCATPAALLRSVAPLLRARSELLLVPAWLLLQAAGLIAARIAPLFAWYFSRFHPGLVLLAGIGVATLAGRLTDRQRLLMAGREGELREGSLDWAREIIAATQPTRVVAFTPWLHIEALAGESDFNAHYERQPWTREPNLKVY